MYFNAKVASAIILFASGALAAPVPQLAGEGAAANSILSSTDNGVGYGIEDALDNTANLITSVKGGVPAVSKARRQLAGEGAAADSILSDTDNGVGYGIEDALDNTANLITSVKGGSTGSTATGGSSGTPPPPPAGPKFRRQGDKISNGVGAVGNALGVGAVTNPVQAAGDNADGSLTSAAANAGASIGSAEESTLEGIGSAVPKFRRQGDKISNGVGAVGNALGLGAVTNPVQAAGDNADGALTSAAANAGASIGSAEESTLEGIGSAVPK
ncbi:hypothetical protein MBLNU13_g05925t1 [Cladosporium sp. NU13]